MPPRDPNLPEGTDSIIDGASDLGGTGVGSSTGFGEGSAFGTSATSSGFGSDDFGSSSSTTGSTGGMDDDIGGSAFGSGAGASGGIKDVQSLKTQAGDKVRDVASQGKDKATDALDSVSRMVSETADTVDERLGPQYGNYVRKAADALDGLNDSIRGKEVDQLFDDARNLVRKSPVVAIGAAAAIGFLLIRLVKSGMPQTIDQDDDYYAAGSSAKLGVPPRVDNSYDPIA